MCGLPFVEPGWRAAARVLAQLAFGWMMPGYTCMPEESVPSRRSEDAVPERNEETAG